MLKVALVATCMLLGSTAVAYAYIDPNAGSLLTQFLAPLTAIVAVGWIVAKEKIATLFASIRHLFSRNEKLDG